MGHAIMHSGAFLVQHLAIQQCPSGSFWLPQIPSVPYGLQDSTGHSLYMLRLPRSSTVFSWDENTYQAVLLHWHQAAPECQSPQEAELVCSACGVMTDCRSVDCLQQELVQQSLGLCMLSALDCLSDCDYLQCMTCFIQ